MKTQLKLKKQLVLTGRQYQLLQAYFIACQRLGFVGPNDYTRVNEIREAFYQWHLVDLIRKFSKTKSSDLVYVQLNWPELKTANAMFKRVECDAELINLQSRFVN